mmetsp:Transcript_9834/g.10609  ORF Transcript_9834/g.10609 Transcript_9834/m.10609 type:complete len:81 (+) Transcript_9834:1077-1319(+)
MRRDRHTAQRIGPLRRRHDHLFRLTMGVIPDHSDGDDEGTEEVDEEKQHVPAVEVVEGLRGFVPRDNNAIDEAEQTTTTT